jgi:hypothetical protein
VNVRMTCIESSIGPQPHWPLNTVVFSDLIGAQQCPSTPHLALGCSPPVDDWWVSLMAKGRLEESEVETLEAWPETLERAGHEQHTAWRG